MNQRRNSKFIEFRNRDIIKLFCLLGFKIRLVGNPEYPNFIMNDSFKLPIIVSGSNITIFNKFDKSGSKVQLEVGRESLDDSIKNIRENVTGSILDIEKREVFKIKYNDLYLHEFKHIEDNGIHTKFPLFSTHNPKIIYTKQYAEEMVDKLSQEGYKGVHVETP